MSDWKVPGMTDAELAEAYYNSLVSVNKAVGVYEGFLRQIIYKHWSNIIPGLVLKRAKLALNGGKWLPSKTERMAKCSDCVWSKNASNKDSEFPLECRHPATEYGGRVKDVYAISCKTYFRKMRWNSDEQTTTNGGSRDTGTV